MNAKRIIICLIGGIVCAGIWVAGIKSGGSADISNAALVSSIGNRILIGFVIGISAWRIHYMLHGILIGLIVSLSVSIGILFDSVVIFLVYIVAGLIYGFLIELFATKVFKAKMA